MTDTNVVVTSSKKRFEDRLKAALAGVEKNLPAASSLVLAGASMTQPEIMKRLQDALQFFQDVRDAKSTQKQKLGALHEQLAPEHKFYTALERSLQGYFGKGSPVLLDFGFALGFEGSQRGRRTCRRAAKAQLTRAAAAHDGIPPESGDHGLGQAERGHVCAGWNGDLGRGPGGRESDRG